MKLFHHAYRAFRPFRLNQKGFGHHIVLPLVVIAAVAFIGMRLIFASHADSINTSCTSSTLKKGTSGDCVSYVQTMVNYYNSNETPTDKAVKVSGKYDVATKTAVKFFQQHSNTGYTTSTFKNLGEVDTNTWDAFCDPIHGVGAPPTTFLTAMQNACATTSPYAATQYSATATFPTSLDATKTGAFTSTYSTNISQSNLIIDAEIYNSAGTQVYQYYQSGQNLSSTPATYNWNWTPTTAGTYTIKLGIFTANWANTLYWDNSAGTIAVGSAPSITCTNTLDGSDTIPLQGGTYNLQADEWDSTEPFTVCNDGGIDFTVSSSGIDNTGGAPGAYPSLYKGCHWGDCTSNSGLPVLVSTMTSTPGTVTTSDNTTTVGSSWDDSYDIWFNPDTSTTNNQTGLEMMIWIDHASNTNYPVGSVVASNVSIGGNTYNVWYGGSGYGTVSYVLTSPVTSVTNLDLGPLAADAVSRGYMQKSWHLIDVEAGFETWVGGQGLTVNSFSVSVK